ncbi:hypothetical protein EDB81DRAFT_765813 [Dactylonectria macrodidyma]|uniref:Uncharacterized protein n=1 Tax=Dactylonectria macrodidyma TaxID=307937 RepID=A0A9P9IL60_9HYPO|nr:hypothetical protein EDB81DRAFT_765813 [Dactylonectria macrodidyma]
MFQCVRCPGARCTPRRLEVRHSKGSRGSRMDPTASRLHPPISASLFRGYLHKEIMATNPEGQSDKPKIPSYRLTMSPHPSSTRETSSAPRRMPTRASPPPSWPPPRRPPRPQTPPYEYMTRFIPEHRRGLLSGNSVHCDRAFLRHEPYAYVDHLHYPHLRH